MAWVQGKGKAHRSGNLDVKSSCSFQAAILLQSCSRGFVCSESYRPREPMGMRNRVKPFIFSIQIMWLNLIHDIYFEASSKSKGEGTVYLHQTLVKTQYSLRLYEFTMLSSC